MRPCCVVLWIDRILGIEVDMLLRSWFVGWVWKLGCETFLMLYDAGAYPLPVACDKWRNGMDLIPEQWNDGSLHE